MYMGLVITFFILCIVSTGIAVLSPLLALTIFISFKISKSKLKIKKYFGYINTGFWLLGLVCFWCYVAWSTSTLVRSGEHESAAISGQIMLPLCGAFIFNAIVSFFSYRSFVRKYNTITISNLNDVKLNQNIQPEEVITKS